MKTIQFKIDGMHCAACSASVERNLQKNQWVQSAYVNLATSRATVVFDETKTGFSDFEKTVTDCGFKIADNQEYNEDAAMRRRLIISAVFTVPLFLTAMLPMMGVFEFLTANPKLYALAQLILCIPVLICGCKFYSTGFKLLFKGAPNMDSLVALGTGAAFLYSLYSLILVMQGDTHSMHNLYFESAAMIITLVMLGKYLEARSKGKAGEAIRNLMDLSPKTAVILKDGKEETVSLDKVETGDILIVKAGDSVPVDGVVVKGNASVDESMLTGESIPVEKTPGSNITGATAVRNGYVEMRAEKIGKDTALAQIIKLVDEASGSKAPIARLADKVSAVFVPVVIAIAVIAMLIWFLLGKDTAFCLKIFISVLVIACPCALGLATPIAIMVATGRGAKNGILFKNAASIQTASSVNVVVFDKTGTITEGKPVVTDISAVGMDETEFLRLCASVEKASNHPLADAVVEKAGDMKLYKTENFKVSPGLGVEADVNGRHVKVGNNKFVGNAPKSEQFENSAKTCLYVSVDDVFAGTAAVADTVKPSAKEAIAMLHKMHVKTAVITGDNQKTAEIIAKSVGIDEVYAQVMPENKAEYVEKLRRLGNVVAMVGDGINDAPALATADVGIAIGGGTDVAIESADVVLVKNNLNDVAQTIRIGKETIRNIKQNLFWAFCYNSLGIPVAAGVLYGINGLLLSPVIAAAAMSLSSVSVVLNAVRKAQKF